MAFPSACAAVSPRAFYGTRKPKEAGDYIRRVRLGQTEHGSFVRTVLSEVPPKLSPSESGKLFDEDLPVPFERRVTEVLLKASAAAVHAAEEAGASGDFKPFEEAIDAGVSGNLCGALAKPLASAACTALEISADGLATGRHRRSGIGCGSRGRPRRRWQPHRRKSGRAHRVMSSSSRATNRGRGTRPPPRRPRAVRKVSFRPKRLFWSLAQVESRSREFGAARWVIAAPSPEIPSVLREILLEESVPKRS